MGPHLPSVVTISALCTSFTSIYFAMNGNVEAVISLVWGAGFLDALDGRLARYLNATSEFGAEIDSLADLVSFGVSPSLCVYVFCLQQFGFWGYLPCCFFTSCMAIRLARFNVKLTGHQPTWGKMFFTGVPAPAGAFLLLLPYSIHVASQQWRFSALAPNLKVEAPTPKVMMAVMIFVGGLLISNIRTFSFKKGDIRRRAVMSTNFMVAVAVVFLAAILYFGRYFVASLLMMCYVLLIPYSHFLYCPEIIRQTNSFRTVLLVY